MNIESQMSVAQLVRFVVVKHTSIWVCPRLDMCVCVFLDLFQNRFSGTILPLVGDVPVDSETHVMTFNLDICLLSLGAYSGRGCACVRRNKCTNIYMSVCVYTFICEKKT